MTLEEIKKQEEMYVMHTYNRFPIALERGKVAVLWDSEGRSYIDMTSGIGVNSLGHQNKALLAAVNGQAEKLLHASNLYYTEPMVRAARSLICSTGMGKVFFANSGAEANEGMIKLARKYSFDKYGEGRSRIITLKQSFHGRTVTTLKATGQDKFHQYFFPFTEGFDYVTPGNIEEMEEKLDDSVCAVMLELIQGEGGVLPLDQEFVKENYPAAYPMYRALMYTYAFTPDAEQLVPISEMKNRYGLVQLWDIFRKEEDRFVADNRRYDVYQNFYRWTGVDINQMNRNAELLLD